MTEDSYYQKKKQESSSIAGTEHLTASQISSIKLELSSEATLETKLEPINNVKAFYFKDHKRKMNKQHSKLVAISWSKAPWLRKNDA